jgi:prohibitin 2
LKGLFKVGGAALFGLYCLNEARFTVEPGHTAVKFSKFTGLGSYQYKEGWHLRLPYFEYPIDFNIQTRPK